MKNSVKCQMIKKLFNNQSELFINKQLIPQKCFYLIKINTQNALILLINISQFKDSLENFEAIKAVEQLCQFIKEVSNDLFHYFESIETSDFQQDLTTLVDVQEGENELQKYSINEQETPKTLIHLSLMLISNLCKNVKLQAEFIQYNDDPKLKGFYFKIFLNAYLNQKSAQCFHFFGNIMLSLSDVKGGRWFMLKDFPEFYMKLRPVIIDKNKERRIHTIGTIKNTCFEYSEWECIKGITEARISEFLIYRLHQIIKRTCQLNQEQTQTFKQLSKQLFLVSKGLDLDFNDELTIQQLLQAKDYHHEVETIYQIYFLLNKLKEPKYISKLHTSLVIQTFVLLQNDYLKDQKDEIQKLFASLQGLDNKFKELKITQNKQEVQEETKVEDQEETSQTDQEIIEEYKYNLALKVKDMKINISDYQKYLQNLKKNPEKVIKNQRKLKQQAYHKEEDEEEEFVQEEIKEIEIQEMKKEQKEKPQDVKLSVDLLASDDDDDDEDDDDDFDDIDD